MQSNSALIMEGIIAQTLQAEEEAGNEELSAGIVGNGATQNACAQKKGYVGVLKATTSREMTSSCT